VSGGFARRGWRLGARPAMAEARSESAASGPIGRRKPGGTKRRPCARLAAMRRARRPENGPPTPATNRARIVGLEEKIERLARLVEQHEHALAIQTPADGATPGRSGRAPGRMGWDYRRATAEEDGAAGWREIPRARPPETLTSASSARKATPPEGRDQPPRSSPWPPGIGFRRSTPPGRSWKPVV
jgi:hypothetical protein